MPWPRSRTASLVLSAALAGWLAPAAASQTSFPFGSALVLDATPLPGSKRVPMIEIEDSGATAIYLWCASVRGASNIVDETITIVPKQATPSQCPPESLSRDVALLTALSQVTGWRRHGDIIDFIGATPLRFRLMTN